MRSVRSSAVLALSLSLATAASLSGCGTSAGAPAAMPSGGTYVDGRTFTMTVSSDPGALDPQMSAVSSLFQMSKFAYDSLVNIDPDGTIVPELATSWKVSGTKATFHLGSGITCSDGTPFTAKTVVDNLSFVENPKNKSPFLGVFVPAGATATASGSTVTVTLASPAPFVLDSFANLPMVCESGLKDRAKLKAGTAGTGPYVLTDAAAGDHYVYTVRKGYTWGPDGATTAAAGTPAEIDVKVVANETTAANELLAGTVNAAAITGPDASRVAAAGLSATDTPALIGEQWYNEAAGHPASDPVVRKALTQALDLGALQKAITSGKGTAATQLAVVPPTGCTGDSVSGHLPATDTAAAAAALDAAGWTKGAGGIRTKDGKKLTVSFLYDAALGTGGSAAAELATAAWKSLGVDVKAVAQPQTQISAAMFGTGNWDVLWEPINVSTPDQIVPFLSGPTLAKGGENFASIDNKQYTELTTKAMGETGSAGCPDWLAAEAALFKAADAVPFANNVVPMFAKGATFQNNGELEPTSIRMLG